MSFSLALPTAFSLPGAARSGSPGWIIIFRTPAAKAAAEAGALLAVFAGLFSLFLGLSVL